MTNSCCPFRVGLGYDIHQLVENRELYLGGVKIPYHLGLLGHTDADVLIHALMDSLLGALALGDIGEHFPDTDEAYKNANSLDLLRKVRGMISAKGYKIGNVDCNILCEKPKLSPFKKQMIQSLANVLSIPKANISIKAGTNEKLDAVGHGKAIACQVVTLLFKVN